MLFGIDQRPSGEQEQDAEQNEEKADAEVFEIFEHGWLNGKYGYVPDAWLGR